MIPQYTQDVIIQLENMLNQCVRNCVITVTIENIFLKVTIYDDKNVCHILCTEKDFSNMASMNLVLEKLIFSLAKKRFLISERQALCI